MPIVLYGIGSMMIADVAETCARLGLQIAASVKNVEGKTYEPPGQTVIRAENVSAELTALEFTVPLFTPFHRRQAAEDARQRGFTRPRTLTIRPRSSRHRPRSNRAAISTARRMSVRPDRSDDSCSSTAAPASAITPT